MLGREGPTVQIGGNIGRMVLDIFRLKGDEARHTLLATGAAAGLAAAFNAPLAGILFIIEEMRPQFRYTLISIKAVFIGVIMSTIMYRIFNHEVALIDVGKLSDAPLNTLWLYLILGIIFGIFGPIFNKWVLGMQDLLHRVHGGNITKWVLMGGAIGGLCGLLGFVAPATSGGGFNLIPIATAGNFSMGMLVFIFVARVITTLLCFSSGAPGGILPRCWRWVLCWEPLSEWLPLSCFRNITLRRERLLLPEWGVTGGIYSRAVNGDHSGSGDDR